MPLDYKHHALTDFLPLSLHDALPILFATNSRNKTLLRKRCEVCVFPLLVVNGRKAELLETIHRTGAHQFQPRSEEHTSELPSPCNIVCRLLLEKKTYS